MSQSNNTPDPRKALDPDARDALEAAQARKIRTEAAAPAPEETPIPEEEVDVDAFNALNGAARTPPTAQNREARRREARGNGGGIGSRGDN